MDLSIVVVNWNTKALLKACIKSVIKETRGIVYELIVVDNGSTDGSVKMIREQFPGIQLLENSYNLGYSKANNQGIKKSCGRYVCLLNSDTVLIDNPLGKTVQFLDQRLNVGAAACLLLNPDGTPQIASALGETNLLYMLSVETGLYKRYPKSRIWGKPFLSYLDHHEIHEVEVCPSAAIVIRKKVFKDVGLLDENIFFGTIDWDFSFRIRKKGWKLFHFPEAQIIHYGGKSKEPIREELMVRDYKSRYYYFWKHYGVFQMNIFRVLIIISSSIKLLSSLFILSLSRYNEKRIQKERNRAKTYWYRLKISLSSSDF